MARLDAFAVFTTVIKAKNFTHAAQLLGLTPSAVSKQISQLEQRLQVRLLNRTTRSISPTEAGQLLYERCQELLAGFAEAEQRVKELDNSPKGTLRISATPTFGRTLLMSLFSSFARRYPDIHIELTFADKPLNLAKEGIDLGLQLGSLQDSRLVAKPLARQPVMLTATPEDLKEFGTPEKLSDLRDHHLLMINGTEFAEPRWSKRFLKEAQLDQKSKRFTVNDLDLLFEACRNGLGITALPIYLVEPCMAQGELVQVLPKVTFPKRTIHVVYPENRYLSSKSRAFIDHISAYFKQHEHNDQRPLNTSD
jgi:DNA-binding transcriptional LysR family regulator